MQREHPIPERKSKEEIMAILSELAEEWHYTDVVHIESKVVYRIYGIVWSTDLQEPVFLYHPKNVSPKEEDTLGFSRKATVFINGTKFSRV